MDQSYRIVPLDDGSYEDFLAFHESECEYGSCYCMYWWVNHDEWDNLTSSETRSMRTKMKNERLYDGYLFYKGDDVVAWCQCHPRDSFPRLAQRFSLLPEKNVWAITCFLVKKDERHQGIMTLMLDLVLEAIKEKGAKAVEAYPRRLSSFDEMYAWNGVEQTYINKGFSFVKSVEGRCVYRYDF